MSRFNKKYLLITLLTAVIILVMLFQIPSVRIGVKTIAVVLNLLVKEGDWRPLELFTQKPAKQEYTIESSSGRTLTINLYYQTKNSEKKTAIIIYTPFLGEASTDPRLINLANTFSRAGFVVAIPCRDVEPLIVSFKDIDDVVSTGLFLKEKKELQIRNLGLFGLSYGNGPTIMAANDSRIKDDVAFIISFAGYYDLQNEFEFIQTGTYSYKDIKGQREPDDYAKEILTTTLNYYQLSEQELVKGEILAQLKKELSPATVIDKLRADFFITHSTDDPYIPYTESLRLYDALKNRDNVYFALNTIFSHGDYKELNFENFKRFYLPSSIDFYKLLYVLISNYGP